MRGRRLRVDRSRLAAHGLDLHPLDRLPEHVLRRPAMTTVENFKSARGAERFQSLFDAARFDVVEVGVAGNAEQAKGTSLIFSGPFTRPPTPTTPASAFVPSASHHARTAPPENPVAYVRRRSTEKRAFTSGHIPLSARTFGSTPPSLRVSFELTTIQPNSSAASRNSSAANLPRARGSKTKSTGHFRSAE